MITVPMKKPPSNSPRSDKKIGGGQVKRITSLDRAVKRQGRGSPAHARSGYCTINGRKCQCLGQNLETFFCIWESDWGTGSPFSAISVPLAHSRSGRLLYVAFAENPASPPPLFIGGRARFCVRSQNTYFFFPSNFTLIRVVS